MDVTHGFQVFEKKNKNSNYYHVKIVGSFMKPTDSLKFLKYRGSMVL